MQLPGGAQAVTVEGLYRGIARSARTDAGGDLRVEVEPHDDDRPDGEQIRELEREYRAVVEEILELRGADAAHRRLPALDRRARARWPTPPATRPTSA